MPKTETSTYPLLNAEKNLKTNIDKILYELDSGTLNVNCINLDAVGTLNTQECIDNIISKNKFSKNYKVDLTNSKNNG